jgi:hypothetical protein
MDLTGDPLTDAVLPAAMAIVWAVREASPVAVAQALTEAITAAGDHSQHALIIVLAAMVPDDLAPSDLLAWRSNPTEYLRLREAGVGAFAAARLAKGSTAA